jgi:hypothetical protein
MLDKNIVVILLLIKRIGMYAAVPSQDGFMISLRCPVVSLQGRELQ